MEMIVNLPGVGENIQEHIYSGTTFGISLDDNIRVFEA